MMKKISFFIILFTLLLWSCKDPKTEKNTVGIEAKKEQTTMAYQCPMDCESGKTYEEQGACAVCKMELKANTTKVLMECNMCKGGECTCNSNDHRDKKLPEYDDKMACAMHKDGNCTCKT